MPKKKKIDIYLSRLSHLSQVLLLILAIFGYFYTILPLYQKELLTEELAKIKIDLANKRNEIIKANQTLASIKERLNTTRLKIIDYEKRTSDLTISLKKNILNRDKLLWDKFSDRINFLVAIDEMLSNNVKFYRTNCEHSIDSNYHNRSSNKIIITEEMKMSFGKCSPYYKYYKIINKININSTDNSGSPLRIKLNTLNKYKEHALKLLEKNKDNLSYSLDYHMLQNSYKASITSTKFYRKKRANLYKVWDDTQKKFRNYQKMDEKKIKKFSVILRNGYNISLSN